MREYMLTVIEGPALENNGAAKTYKSLPNDISWIDGYLNARFPHFTMVGVGSQHSIKCTDDIEGYFDDVDGGVILVFEREWKGAPSAFDVVAVIKASDP